MKKIIYVVTVFVMVLLGFKLKVSAAPNEYEFYIHVDGYAYWMPDYTQFSTNNGLFKFSDFKVSADDSGSGSYYHDVNAMFDFGDVRRVEIYQEGGWYPLDSYEISHNDWGIQYNATTTTDKGYTLIAGDFNFFYQVSDNILTDDDLAGIRFVYNESQIIKNPKTVNSDVISNYLLYTEVDYYMYDLPDDIIKSDIIVDGDRYQYKASNNGNLLDVGYWMITSTNQLRIMVEKNKVINNPITLTYETAEPEKQDLIYNFNLMNYPESNALYDANMYNNYNPSTQYLSVRFKSIDIEKIIDMNNGIMPEIIFKVNGTENNFYPYEVFKLATGSNMIRDRTFLFHIDQPYNNTLYMAFNFRYPEYLNEYHQYMLDKAEVDIRKLQVTIIFKDVIVDDETSIDELIQQAYNRGYSDGLTIGYQDAFNAGYDEGKRIADILQYQDGYEAGYEDGAVAGNEEAFNAGYDAGFTVGAQESEAYNVGYADGANESFLGSMDKWLVPSIIIVMLLGGFFAIARKKRDGDI